jgi:hypothetical protein
VISVESNFEQRWCKVEFREVDALYAARLRTNVLPASPVVTKPIRDNAARTEATFGAIRRPCLNAIQLGSFEKQQWTIRIRDENDTPLWLVHPGTRIDIAVLPFLYNPKEHIVTLYPLNVLANYNLRIEIGMEVFILGYPFKIEPPAYPVWKRGSIASEPQLARLTTDYMLVDTASRPCPGHRSSAKLVKPHG